ncbi:hypothetical protein CYY_002825 [Polysphondylium violaceum]|uniref:Ependymin-related protein n=1 Tax=Polysphondylium violaceum TaxID=133409 RepID=A0A8J4PZJ3_9MYCE|nr:hypothetical protein CYY_002825 [Polysphondylium violaceum]
MKFISIALLLVLSISFTFAASCNMNSGYASRFTMNAYNTIFPSESGEETLTFFEIGYINVDFTSQQMMTMYEILIQGQPIIAGELYAFGQNKTMYVVNEVNNQTVCHQLPLDYPIPSGPPKIIKDNGQTYIGAVPVESLQIDSNNGPNVVEEMLFDYNTCSPLASYISNVDRANPGISTMVFIDYVNTPTPFTMPEICLNAQPADANMFRLPRSTKAQPVTY